MRFNIILAVLAVALAVPSWITLAGERSEDFVDTGTIPMLFPGFSADLVAVIEIKRRLSEEVIKAQEVPPEQAFEGLVFQREGDRWVLLNDGPFKGLEMDPNLVQRDILEHVTALRLDRETLVPQEKVTEAFRRDNELTEDTGLTIRCMRGLQGPEVAKLVLGKSTSRGKAGKDAVQGYYVCNPDRPREVVIYEPQSQHWIVSLRPSDWAKKNIHEFLITEVDTFYYANALGSAGFKRQPGAAGKWVAIPEQCRKGTEPLDLEKLGTIKQETVAEFIDRYKVIRAEGFVRVKIPQDSVGNEVELRAMMTDGTEYVLYVGGTRDEKACLAVSSHHKFQFEISEFHVSAFKRQDPQDFFHPR